MKPSPRVFMQVDKVVARRILAPPSFPGQMRDNATQTFTLNARKNVRFARWGAHPHPCRAHERLRCDQRFGLPCSWRFLCAAERDELRSGGGSARMRPSHGVPCHTSGSLLTRVVPPLAFKRVISRRRAAPTVVQITF